MKGLPIEPLPLFAAAGEEEQGEEPAVSLPVMKIGQHVMEDYRTLHLTLKQHPIALLRGRMTQGGYVPSARLSTIDNDKHVKVAGLVLVRQRPGTASGVIFATLEDETGIANIIIWPKIFERYRRIVLTSSLLGVDGKLQREGIVIHVIADRLVDLSHRLRTLADSAEEVTSPLARADEVKRPGGDTREKVAARAADMRSVRDPAFPSRDFH